MSESMSFLPGRFHAAGEASCGQPAEAIQTRTTSDRPPVDTESGAGACFRRTTTRADLLDAVYTACPSLSRNQARDIFEMALEEVAQTLTRGESVKLRAFGLFSVREKRERIGRNPRTGQEVPIKPRRVLTFKASPVLLDELNGREADEDAS